MQEQDCGWDRTARLQSSGRMHITKPFRSALSDYSSTSYGGASHEKTGVGGHYRSDYPSESCLTGQCSQIREHMMAPGALIRLTAQNPPLSTKPNPFLQILDGGNYDGMRTALPLWFIAN